MSLQRKARSICVYGKTKDGKTSNLYFLAKYLKKKYPSGKIRLISGDGGGEGPFFDDPEMIESGYVEYFDISNCSHPLSTIRLLSEGYWPNSRGEMEPNDSCRIMPSNCSYFVEGITSISKSWENYMSTSNEVIAYKSMKYQETIDDRTITFGGLDEGHYGLSQQELYRIIVHGFEALSINYLVMTALVGYGDDKFKQDKAYGPKASGNAVGAQIPSWFADTWYLESIKNGGIEEVIENDIKVEKPCDIFVAWFKSHNDDETGKPYLAGIRLLPQYVGMMKKQLAGGRDFLVMTERRGIDKFYEWNDKLNEFLRKEKEKQNVG